MRYLLFTLSIVIGLSGVASAMAETPDKPKEKAKQEGVVAASELLTIQPDDKVLGERDAPVVLIEYASISCAHCAHFHNEVLPGLKPYIEEGKLAFVFRDFPLNAPALAASITAHCAEENYYPMLETLFKTQDDWAFTKKFEAKITNLAKLSGVSEKELLACKADKNLQDRILQSRVDAAKALNVRSTPTLFINGTIFDKRRTVENVSEAIDKTLKEAKAE